MPRSFLPPPDTARMMRRLPLIIAGALTLASCTTGRGEGNSGAEFDEAAYEQIVGQSGRRFTSQSACRTFLDRAYARLTLDARGALLPGVIVSDTFARGDVYQRSMRRPGAHNICGAPPPPGIERNCSAPGAPADQYRCSGGVFDHQVEAPVP